MWQRIQTLYFGIATALIFSMFFCIFATIIGPDGVKGKVPVDLTYDEQQKLRASAEALKSVIKSLDI